MSGGYFDYQQYRLEDIALTIEELIKKNDRLDEPNASYSRETMTEFRKAVFLLRKAGTYAQRIDWLVSADDSEEDFHERLKEELEKIENDYS